MFTAAAFAEAPSSDDTGEIPETLEVLTEIGEDGPVLVDHFTEVPELPAATPYPYRYYPGDSRLKKASRLVVSIPQQRLFVLNPNGETLHEWKVSTGLPGYRTPTGDFQIYNSFERAYSEKYEAMMLDWMAITRDGMYGIHGLEGWGYYQNLGRPASHGCIRLSREHADQLRGMVGIGTPVKIVGIQVDFPSYERAENQRRKAFYQSYLKGKTAYTF